jgi:predicted Zn-dependent protease
MPHVLLVSLLAAGVSAITLVSVEREIEIGRRMSAELRRQAPVVRDWRTQAYVADVGRRLARAASGPRYPYTFTVVDAAELNAFALPGGPVWIHRGLLAAVDNEAQAAAALAHEIAHIDRRHVANRLTTVTVTGWGLALLGAMLGNSGGATAARAAADAVAGGVFLKFSRDDEAEADRVGLDMLAAAGWDGRGMVELFEMLDRRAGGERGRIDAFLSSHPSPEDRARRLQTLAAAGRGGTHDSAAFRAVRDRLRSTAADR